MPIYKTLKSENSHYDHNLLDRLELLYKGGYHMQRNASVFLKQLAAESDVSYDDRLCSVAYLPYMSDIIDYYASMLFAGEISIDDAADAEDDSTIGEASEEDSVYELFQNAADLKGQSFEDAMRHTFTDSLMYGHAYVGIDFPKVDELPVNLLEEEINQSARPYLYDIDAECVIDWSLNESGRFDWVKLKSDNIVQPSPLVAPKHQIEFKIWTMDGGVAKWELYQTKLLDIGKYPAPNDEIALADSGTTTFREIPVLKLCLPPGLAIGVKIGPICEDIFQRSSILVNGENKSIQAMRIVFLGDEGAPPGGAPASMVSENPYRHLQVSQDWESKGFGVLGKDDDMRVVEAEGKAFTVVEQQIDKLIEKLKEVVHQMANSSSKAKAKAASAVSKQEDRHATEMLLTAYGSIMRDFIKQIMSCISSARGESIVWAVDGLDNFTIIDRTQLMLEATAFPLVAAQSKSKTFTKLYTGKFYTAMLDGASHEDLATIREEIEETVDAMPDPKEADPLDVNGMPIVPQEDQLIANKDSLGRPKGNKKKPKSITKKVNKK